MGAILLTGSVIGERAIVAAGALIREGQEIPPASLAVGVPAKVLRDVTEAELERARRGKDDYVSRGKLMQQSCKDSRSPSLLARFPNLAISITESAWVLLFL